MAISVVVSVAMIVVVVAMDEYLGIGSTLREAQHDQLSKKGKAKKKKKKRGSEELAKEESSSSSSIEIEIDMEIKLGERIRVHKKARKDKIRKQTGGGGVSYVPKQTQGVETSPSQRLGPTHKQPRFFCCKVQGSSANDDMTGCGSIDPGCSQTVGLISSASGK